MRDIDITRMYENLENPDCYQDDAPEVHECKYCGEAATKEVDLISGNETICSSEFGLHICDECLEEIRKDYYIERCDEID